MADESQDRDDEFPEEAGRLVTLFSDTFFLTIGDAGIRIAFGEDLGGKAYYRSAIQMPSQEAEALANQIIGLLKRWREREVKAE